MSKCAKCDNEIKGTTYHCEDCKEDYCSSCCNISNGKMYCPDGHCMG